MGDTGAIVLAGGEGRRFGGPKQLALLAGRPLLAYPVAAARSALGRVVVVLGAHAAAVRQALGLADHEAVVCAGWEGGQAASLRAGVAALGEVERAVVLLGDMPGVTAAVIEGAVERLGAEVDVVRTVVRGEPTHPVVLGPRALALVPTLRGDTGARALFGTLCVNEWDATDLFDPADVDTPEQLEALAARWD